MHAPWRIGSTGLAGSILAPFDAAFAIAADGRHDAAKGVGQRARRAQRQRRLKGCARSFAVMRNHAEGKATKRQCKRVVAPVFNCSMGMVGRAASVLLARAAAQEQDFVAPSGQPMRQGVVGLEGKRALEQRQRFSCPLRY